MKFFKVCYFDLKNILRNPMLVIVNTVLPLVLIWAFGLISRRNFGGALSSYDYYAVTGMIMSGMLVSMTVTNTFMEENVKKGNFRLAYLPVSKTTIFMSKLISTFGFATVSYIMIILALQFIAGCNLGRQYMGYFILLIIFLNFFSCSLGTMFCCLLRSEERANAVVPMIDMFFITFGGIFMPVGHLKGVFKLIAVLSPLKRVTESAFQVIYSHQFKTYYTTLLELVVLSCICIVISELIYKPEEYVA